MVTVDITKYEIMAAKNGVALTAEVEELLVAIALDHMTAMDGKREEGIQEGKVIGFEIGYSQGEERGERDGFADKALKIWHEKEEDFQAAYDEGYREGHSAGYAEGWCAGRKAVTK